MTFMPTDSANKFVSSSEGVALFNQYTVTLLDKGGSHIAFPCGPNEPIYKAGERAGYELTLGCMQGRCTICKAKLISGEVKFLRPIPKEAEGCLPGAPDILLCSYAPQVDTTLQPYGRWLQRA